MMTINEATQAANQFAIQLTRPVAIQEYTQFLGGNLTGVMMRIREKARTDRLFATVMMITIAEGVHHGKLCEASQCCQRFLYNVIFAPLNTIDAKYTETGTSFDSVHAALFPSDFAPKGKVTDGQ